MHVITTLSVVPRKGVDVDQLIADIVDHLRKKTPTWGRSNDGRFHHRGEKSREFPSGQWWYRAALQPPVKSLKGLVVFEVIPCRGELDDEAAAIYLGRLVEQLISHFSDRIKAVVVG